MKHLRVRMGIVHPEDTTNDTPGIGIGVSSGEDAVTATAVTARYGTHIAVSETSFRLPVGRSMAIIGPNGSGKSTLLKVMAGIHRASSGSVELPGMGRVAFVLQSTEVDRDLPMTVREAVSMARFPNVGRFRPFRRRDRAAVDEAMEQLEIADLQRRQIHELSGGQRQRMLVAQGIAQESDVLLLDEPVTGLDVTSQQRILEVVATRQRDGLAVAMTTHHLGDAQRCDLVLLLATRPVAVGTPSEVLTAAHLQEAYGGRMVNVDGALLFDDHTH